MPLKSLLFSPLPLLSKFRQISISSFIFPSQLTTQPTHFCSSLDFLFCYVISGILSQPFVFKALQWHHSQTRWELWKGYYTTTFNFIIHFVIICLCSNNCRSMFFSYLLLIKWRRTAGVYADMDFKEGELVLKDQMLVGAQHSFNKVLLLFFSPHMFVCSCVVI